MDRNSSARSSAESAKKSLSARRAWIEIGDTRTAVSAWIPSLSARRAWIEIPVQQPENTADEVALRKEGVERNALSGGHDCYSTQSLSARRAWIEIQL